MPYLYFHPKATCRTNIKWAPPPLHQKINSLLENCCEVAELNQIHSQMIRTGLIQDTLLVSRIIAFFTIPSNHFNMDYARRVFDQIPHPNSFIWNSMLRGYTQNHAPKDALSLYKQMLLRGFSPDNYTYPIVIKACSRLPVIETGEVLHGQILKIGFGLDMFVVSGLVSFYATCGRKGVARLLFDEMPERDVVSWTTMISAYAQAGCPEEALVLFDEMRTAGVEPNKVTVMSLLSACGQLQNLDSGRQLHSYILESKMECDIHIKNSLINMYAKCGCMSAAVEIFRNMPTRNTVSWNVMIGGYAQSGLAMEALALFMEMEQSDLRPNEITMVNALSACAILGDLGPGKLLHAYIKEHMIGCDVFVGNALVTMYAKCGDLEEALRVFHEMPERDIFSWTVMISSYVKGKWFKEALALFKEMQLLGVKPNEVTLVSLLSACYQLGALDQGKLIHSYIEENNVRQDVCLGNALVDMYAKCGCINTALRVFHSMPQKDAFSWNAMIGGLAIHGRGREALSLFDQMQRIGDMRPDAVTLMAVLCACTHLGMVHEGYFYFNSMSRMYGFTPTIEHYGCMVDLLGKAGLVEEANEFIEKMPFEPNHVILGSLLAACRVNCKVGVGEKIARQILELAPDDEGAHVLMSNIYAEAGRWEDVRRVRNLMGDRSIEKSPGCSVIEVNGIIHEFVVGETLGHYHGKISSVLNSLTLQLKLAVYETSCSQASFKGNNVSKFMFQQLAAN